MCDPEGRLLISCDDSCSHSTVMSQQFMFALSCHSWPSLTQTWMPWMLDLTWWKQEWNTRQTARVLTCCKDFFLLRIYHHNRKALIDLKRKALLDTRVCVCVCVCVFVCVCARARACDTRILPRDVITHVQGQTVGQPPIMADLFSRIKGKPSIKVELRLERGWSLCCHPHWLCQRQGWVRVCRMSPRTRSQNSPSGAWKVCQRGRSPTTWRHSKPK